MFSLRLKELREKNGYSQYSLADALGVAQSTIGNWEAGKREPNFDTLQRLAKFFNVSTDYLLGIRDEDTIFYLRLTELLEKSGHTPYSFAIAFGITLSTFRSWESGKCEPDSATMQRLADFFCVDVDYLLGRELSDEKGIEFVLENAQGEIITSFHLSEEEDELFWARFRESLVQSPAEYLRQIITTGEVKSPSSAELVERILCEQRMQTDDINQIIKTANESGKKHEELDELAKHHEDMIALLESTLQRLNKHNKE